MGNVKAATLPAGRHVDVGEIRRLFQFCGDRDTPAAARDAALLTLLYGCGMRRSEAVALVLDDYREGAVTVRTGKGRKERLVYAPAGGREAIDSWIAHRGSWHGSFALPGCEGGEDPAARRMTAQAVLLRLRFLAKKAGICHSFSPHDLRRSFVGELLNAGADISSVQQLAGHANVGTTQRYDLRPEEAKRRAAEMLHIPYVAQADAGRPFPPDPDPESPRRAGPPPPGAPG